MVHNCYLASKEGDLLYICSRCNGCYVCRHKFLYFEAENKWYVKCRDGRIRPVILDGKLKSRVHPILQGVPFHGNCVTQGHGCLLSDDEQKILGG